MRTFIVTTGLVAIAVAGAWAWQTHSWDAYVALVAAVFALTSASVWERRRSSESRAMQQRVGRAGIAIQSGRDTHIGAGRENRNG